MITQEDVARECGLSVTTVSRVLNHRGYISQETYDKVYAAMRKLNYTPNEIARSLSRSNTGTIGVILPNIYHPYFSKCLNALEIAASDQGLKLMLFSSRRDQEVVESCVEKCRAGILDGVILYAGEVDTEPFARINVPLITVERMIDTAAASVECDNFEGGTLAAQELIGAGCRALMYIGSVDDGKMPAHDRYQGFSKICRQYGVWHEQMMAGKHDFEQLDYHSRIDHILDEYPQVDGIFASSDVIAAQVLQAARRRGCSVPDDLRVVGFDDTLIAKLTVPPLTTIHQPVEEMAEKAISLLMRAISGKPVARKTVLPIYLVKRETL